MLDEVIVLGIAAESFVLQQTDLTQAGSFS